MKTMSKAIRAKIVKAGLNVPDAPRKTKITPYVLTRHTGCTELYEESGENIEMVSQAATRSDSRITRARYVKDRISGRHTDPRGHAETYDGDQRNGIR